MVHYRPGVRTGLPHPDFLPPFSSWKDNLWEYMTQDSISAS